MTMDCKHDCYLCVTEAKCQESHIACLGVCDKHMRVAIDYAVDVDALRAPGDIIRRVMHMTGGRANPQRVVEMVEALP